MFATNLLKVNQMKFSIKTKIIIYNKNKILFQFNFEKLNSEFSLLNFKINILIK